MRSTAYQNGLMLRTSTSIPIASIACRRFGPIVSAAFGPAPRPHHLPDTGNLAVRVHVHRRDPASAHDDLPAACPARRLPGGSGCAAHRGAGHRHAGHCARGLSDELPAGRHLFLRMRQAMSASARAVRSQRPTQPLHDTTGRSMAAKKSCPGCSHAGAEHGALRRVWRRSAIRSCAAPLRVVGVTLLVAVLLSGEQLVEQPSSLFSERRVRKDPPVDLERFFR